MNVLQTLPASCSQVDQENVKLKIKNFNMIFFLSHAKQFYLKKCILWSFSMNNREILPPV